MLTVLVYRPLLKWEKKRIIELQGEPVHQHCETLRTGNFFQSHEIVGSLNSLKNCLFFIGRINLHRAMISR